MFALVVAMLCGAMISTACGAPAEDGDADGGTTRDGGRDGAMNEGGTNPDGGGGDDDPEIALFDDENDERVTDILCVSATECLVSTDSNTGAGHVYTTDGHTITGTVLTGDTDFTAEFMQLGDVGFLGFERFDDRLVVRLDNGATGFVTATADYTETASYSVERIGTPNDRGSFGTSDQHAFAFDGTTWTYLVTGSLFETTTLPGTSAAFTNVWAPQLITPVPANIAALRQGDATICNADPAVSFSPARLQVAHVSSDASFIVAASGAPNQSGFHGAGVCIRRAGDAYFHYAPFPGLTKGQGPLGITCNTADHCVAVGGVRNVSPASVFVTNNASAGSGSTWVRATTPTFSSSVELVYTAFAPDGLHGWIAGRDGGAYLLATTDGGATWTNATSMVSAYTDAPLHVVYAPDATHVFVGGEDDTLLAFGY